MLHASYFFFAICYFDIQFLFGFSLICAREVAYCHAAPRASVYHGLVYFGDFRPQRNDGDDGIPVLLILLMLFFASPARRF